MPCYHYPNALNNLDLPLNPYKLQQNEQFSRVVSPRGKSFVFTDLFYEVTFVRNRAGQMGLTIVDMYTGYVYGDWDGV
jgi:hypothetical protein